MATILSRLASQLRSRFVPVVLGLAMLGIVLAAAVFPNTGLVEAQSTCPYGNCGGAPSTPFFQTPAGEATIAGIIAAIVIAALLAIMLLRRRAGGGGQPPAEAPPSEEPPAAEGAAEEAPPAEAPAEEAPAEQPAAYDESAETPAEPEGGPSIEEALDELERETQKYNNR